MKETLRRLLNPGSLVGTVIGMRDGKAEIATAQGRIEAIAPAGLAVGDTVNIEQGRVVRLHRARAADTYFV